MIERRSSGPITMFVLLVIMVAAGCNRTDSGGQATYSTPQEAADALVAACLADDIDALTRILGEAHREVYVTSDTASDRETRQTFAEAAGVSLTLEEVEPGTIELVVGENDWPLPIPLVQEDSRWRFDMDAGAEEVLDRRVGRNELHAIDFCRRAIEAQSIYRSQDLDGNGIEDYASSLYATPGNHDGLHWVVDPDSDEMPSPLHDFIEDQTDYLGNREEGSPWRGYYARLLKAQGPNAPGGAADFERDGLLMDGHALLLWPSDYGYSGVMTFLVSHHGEIFETDLGPDTAELVGEIQTFDPDDSWSVVGDS